MLCWLIVCPAYSTRLGGGIFGIRITPTPFPHSSTAFGYYTMFGCCLSRLGVGVVAQGGLQRIYFVCHLIDAPIKH